MPGCVKEPVTDPSENGDVAWWERREGVGRPCWESDQRIMRDRTVSRTRIALAGD